MGKEHLVNYLLASEEMERELEEQQTECWRVYDGEKWKFSVASKEKAVEMCKRLNGKCIGYAVWDDEHRLNNYIEVELVK